MFVIPNLSDVFTTTLISTTVMPRKPKPLSATFLAALAQIHHRLPLELSAPSKILFSCIYASPVHYSNPPILAIVMTFI